MIEVFAEDDEDQEHVIKRYFYFNGNIAGTRREVLIIEFWSLRL
jgi:hypothetical protein